MRASIIIAAHNEGQSLWKTIRSCIESIGKLDYEIVIADDASDDESVSEALRRFPPLSVHRHEQRQGASPTKHSGARNASGEVLVFRDGHCNPELGTIERLVEDVERVDGQSLITPTILALDTGRWKNKESQVGHGYRLELDTFDCGWLPLASLRKVRSAGREFYESPAAIGCAFAVHRELYEDLRGFDPHMRIWGVEDLDFSLKCWLMGHSILHDPEARIGHRFRENFDNYDVPVEHILVNKLRMAYKNFTQAVWSEWLERCRHAHAGRLHEHPEGLWACAWKLFNNERNSAEQERAYLLARRQRDEFWYAQQFELSWPRLEATGIMLPGPRVAAMQHEEGADASGSPPPGTVNIHIDGVDDDEKETVGAVLVRRFDANNAPRRKITLASDIGSGAVRLSLQNSRLRVFDAEVDGVELMFNGTDNVFPVASLPDKVLWVQGHLPSVTMRDTSLTLTHTTEGAADRVTFTVLWVTIEMKFSASESVAGEVTAAGDNNRKDNYKAERIPPAYDLGPGVFAAGHGWGVLTTGVVDPHDFPFEIVLERNAEGRIYVNEQWSALKKDFPADPNQIPSNDIPPPGAAQPTQDRDPQSDMSDGHVYDWDIPFVNTKNAADAVGTIRRLRANFRSFASYQGIRASEVKQWFTAQSYIKKATGWDVDETIALDNKATLGEPILLSASLGPPAIAAVDPAVLDKSEDPSGIVAVKLTGENFVDEPSVVFKKNGSKKMTTFLSGRANEVRYYSLAYGPWKTANGPLN